MLAKFYKNKIDYKDFIVMIKIGNFYEIFDKDAVITSKLLNYKLSKFSDTVKCGFPISSLEKVSNIFKQNEINYVALDNDNVVSKNNFENNKYNDFNIDLNVIKYNYFRINKIIKYLNDNADTISRETLDKLENVINE